MISTRPEDQWLVFDSKRSTAVSRFKDLSELPTPISEIFLPVGAPCFYNRMGSFTYIRDLAACPTRRIANTNAAVRRSILSVSATSRTAA